MAKDKDVVRIKTGVRMHAILNSAREEVIEIPRAEWDDMSEEEREGTLRNIADTTIENQVEVWAFVEEDEG